VLILFILLPLNDPDEMDSFLALMLMVRRQEGHVAWKEYSIYRNNS